MLKEGTRYNDYALEAEYSSVFIWFIYIILLINTTIVE